MTDKKNNIGKENTGENNSGDGNSGNRNSGDGNSGYGNSTERETGIFNSTPGTLRMFNQPTDKKWDEIAHPNFNDFYVTKWIPESKMTDKEKIADPEFYIRQGYLKKYEYKEAWANFWKDTGKENRQKFLDLPNFDAEVFKAITGIDVEAPKTESDEITVNGVRYRKVESSKE